MFNEIKWPDTPFDLKEHLVMVMEVGSVSHGTRIPPSDPDSIDDIDIMAVAIAPKEYYLGFQKWKGKSSIKGEWDVVVYEFRKYISLLTKQNPNVIGTLWLDNYVYLSPIGQRVIENRMLFQHRKRAFDSFVGYATAQLKKMERGAFKGYMGEKRKELVERYGYDTKNASHLIRLLHMGTEYLDTCRMEVKRTWDREMLMSIKTGEWPIQKVKEYAENKFDEIKKVYESSQMQQELPLTVIIQLLIECLEAQLWAK